MVKSTDILEYGIPFTLLKDPSDLAYNMAYKIQCHNFGHCILCAVLCGSFNNVNWIPYSSISVDFSISICILMFY